MHVFPVKVTHVTVTMALLCLLIVADGISVKAQDSFEAAASRRKIQNITDLLNSAKFEIRADHCDLAIGYAADALSYADTAELQEWVYKERGLTYHCKQDYQNAINDFTQCLKLSKFKVYYYERRAYEYVHMKSYGSAIADFSEIIALEPKNTTAYDNRARAYLILKDYPAAIDDFTAMIGLGGGNQSHFDRAKAFRELKDYESALKDFTYLIGASQGKPKYQAEMYYERGRTYFLMEKYEEALQDAVSSLTIDAQAKGSAGLVSSASQKIAEINEKARSKKP